MGNFRRARSFDLAAPAIIRLPGLAREAIHLPHCARASPPEFCCRTAKMRRVVASALKKSLGWFRSDRDNVVAWLLLPHAVFLLFVILRMTGSLQEIELLAYDGLVRMNATPAESPWVTLVGVNDVDFDRFTFPLSDEILARAIDKL